ncbi:MAG: hypothetical protein J7485_09535 [Sphingobium sp.]|nr:hypothetical protein [Sphingobium sp.]
MIAASAVQAKNPHLAFVACPIVQDTSTVPCWLVQDHGETFYMGIQSDVSADFNPPSLGHKVLVEGTMTDKMVCGARVIEPIRISIMPELSPECGELRVVREGVDLGFEPPRPPGPSGGRLAFAPPAAPSLPKPPFSAKTFIVPYDFEGMVGFRTPYVLTPALDYGQTIKASRIEVTGYRGATRLSDGRLLTEHQGIARERANEVVRMLRGAGLDETRFTVVASEAPKEGGPELRRVEIKIIP